jgi:hypothetical protein
MISSSRVSVARQAVRSTTSTTRRSSTLARSRIPRSLATVLKKQQNLFLRPLQYSTERVLKLRGGDPKTKTLYDGSKETENCGVGLIAHLKSNPSRHVVDVADEMLVRMAHRGGCGCDPASGDGAGKLAFISYSLGWVSS